MKLSRAERKLESSKRRETLNLKWLEEVDNEVRRGIPVQEVLAKVRDSAIKEEKLNPPKAHEVREAWHQFVLRWNKAAEKYHPVT